MLAELPQWLHLLAPTPDGQLTASHRAELPQRRAQPVATPAGLLPWPLAAGLQSHCPLLASSPNTLPSTSAALSSRLLQWAPIPDELRSTSILVVRLPQPLLPASTLFLLPSLFLSPPLPLLCPLAQCDLAASNGDPCQPERSCCSRARHIHRVSGRTAHTGAVGMALILPCAGAGCPAVCSSGLLI